MLWGPSWVGSTLPPHVTNKAASRHGQMSLGTAESAPAASTALQEKGRKVRQAWGGRGAVGPVTLAQKVRSGWCRPGVSLFLDLSLLIYKLARPTGLSSRRHKTEPPKPGKQLALTSAGPHHMRKQQPSIRLPPFASDPQSLSAGLKASRWKRKPSPPARWSQPHGRW